MSVHAAHSKLQDKALALLLANRVSGYSRHHSREYAYTCPSIGRYPYQWFWDSCFHAVALSHYQPDWAQKELQSLIAVQREDGFLPHVIFWELGAPRHYWKYLQAGSFLRPAITLYIQPPVIARAALTVFRASGDLCFARQMLAAVRRFHTWLRCNRDPDGDGLISIVSPFESGMDWSPQFDGLFRGALDACWFGPRRLDFQHRLCGHRTERMLARFDVEEVATNSIWFDAQKSLATLAKALGDQAVAEEETCGALQTQRSLLEKCWNAETGAFFSLAGPREAMLGVRTVASLTPLLLDHLSPQQLDCLVSEIEDARGYGTCFPLPSVAVREPPFRGRPRQFLWRGPTWMNMNWFVVRGLLKHGQHDLACRVAQASASAIDRSGFRECYEPHKGDGLGARQFGWSTLVVDMLSLTA